MVCPGAIISVVWHGEEQRTGTDINKTVNQLRSYLCPLALTELTFLSLKSNSRSGKMKGAMKPPLAASTWILMSQPFFLFNSSAADKPTSSLPHVHTWHSNSSCDRCYLPLVYRQWVPTQ